MPRPLREIGRAHLSEDGIVSNPNSPRSNTIPLIQLGRSLDNVRGFDTESVCKSVENLDGFTEDRISYRSDIHSERKFFQNQNLDNLISQQEFQTLGLNQKYELVGQLLPLLRPYATNLDRELNEITEKLNETVDKLETIENIKNGVHVGYGLQLPVSHLGGGDTTSAYSGGAYPPDYGQIVETIGGPPSPTLIRKSRIVRKRVCLNVGGIKHEVMWRMLEQIPNSRLGLLCRANTHQEIMALVTDYSLLDNEYFFDRHPRSFNTILNFYRTGKLHLADEMCIMAFLDDLSYWGIPEPYLESCCENKLKTKKDTVLEEMEIEAGKLTRDDEEDFGPGKLAKYQKFLWDLIEKPDTSFAAKVVSSISIIFVVISTVGMTLNTMEYFQHQDVNGNAVDNPKLALVESVCISWFTLEYLLRFAGSPNKWEFLKDGMNIVDVLAIMPYYVSLFLVADQSLTEAKEEDEDKVGFDEILQVFRIFKLARILKLGRHSPGLQSIVHTLKMSYRELGLLVMLVFLSGLIFASLCYFLEEGKDSGFTSIPTGIYWVVITMTTVGYGDIYPVTGLGKLVGSLCAISGVLVMGLPIPIIAGNFERFHKEQAKRTKLQKRRARLKEAREMEEKKRLSEILGDPEDPSCSGGAKQFKAKSPAVSLLTARTWGSRKSSVLRSNANSPIQEN